MEATLQEMQVSKQDSVGLHSIPRITYQNPLLYSSMKSSLPRSAKFQQHVDTNEDKPENFVMPVVLNVTSSETDLS